MTNGPEVFLQWKGTDACLDLWCPCGRELHFDGYFASQLTCGNCAETWQLPHTLKPEPVTPDRPLTVLLGDVDVIPAEPGSQFRVRWPRAELAAKPGDIWTIVEEHDGCLRAAYADLLRVDPGPEGDGLWVLLKSRGRGVALVR
jgi:hypothetical protein